MPNDNKRMASLRKIAAMLDGAGMQWALFAGAAASVYGAERAITDVDILVPHGEAQRLLDLFPKAELEYAEPGLTHFALPGVDLLAGLGAVDLDAPMAARTTHHELGGIQVPVISREDNILLKAIWGRGADQDKHDWEDVEAMMAAAPSLDWQYLHWRATTLDEPELLPGIMERLEGLWGRLHGKEEGQDE